MPKKDDSPSNPNLESKSIYYTLENIFKSCFCAKKDNDELVDFIVKKICNINDYMKSVFCVGMAIEILKPNGLKIEISNNTDDNFSYFIKSQNKIILNTNANTSIIYVSLLDLFLYKWLSLIDISDDEKENLKDVLDVVSSNSNVFYEELTQKEIKMLEWLDEKLVGLIQSLDQDTDIYKVDMDSIDISVANLLSVYLMWGRNLERLEIVSQILNPILDYINDTILTKFEQYISENELLIKNLPEYFKIKLNTIKMFKNRDIPHKKVFKLLKEIRILDIPQQTPKTFKKFKDLLDNNKKNSNLKVIFDEFKKEKSLYEYSILQRYDELNYIKDKKNNLANDIKNNREIIDQLMNLEYLINGEVKDLKESLAIIDKKINLLKKAGV